MSIDSSAWATAAFAPGAFTTWVYNWPNIGAGTHMLSVKATDYAGRVATTSKSVTVNDVNVVYVSPAGNNNNTGRSWGQALATISQATNVGTGLASYDIWVARGTYVGGSAINSPGCLYGGFAGAETAREQRNWAANATVLDGGGTGTVLSMRAYATPCVADGFTIQNGFGDMGSGVGYVGPGPATISHDIIQGNVGGGIYGEMGPLTVTDNWILNNTGETDGGGIFLYNSNPVILNNTFTGNTILGYGGAVYLTYCTSAAVSNNIVASNTSGVYADTTGGAVSLHAVNNDLWSNTGDDSTYLQAGPNDNISANPLFLDSAAGGYQLCPNSPCRNAGSDSTGLTDTLDIDCMPRTAGSYIDIGAAQYYASYFVSPSSTVVYVRSDSAGNDANGGLSWGSAVHTVQKGIDLAYLYGGGDVWVQAGTYHQVGLAPAVAYLMPFVSVYGGFAGTETSLSQRSWTANPTILSGGGSCGVVFICGGISPHIDGFTITGGSAADGGGAYCNGSSPTIENCVITADSAANGGGVYCCGGSLSIINCAVSSNSAGGSNPSSNCGDGIYCCGCSSVTISGSAITQNGSASSNPWGGGGVYCVSSPVTISNSTIANNACHGIACRACPAAVISGCAITGNRYVSINNQGDDYDSDDGGGGIYCDSVHRGWREQRGVWIYGKHTTQHHRRPDREPGQRCRVRRRRDFPRRRHADDRLEPNRRQLLRQLCRRGRRRPVDVVLPQPRYHEQRFRLQRDERRPPR